MKLYLIAGFLGAGKTTFLKNLIRQYPPCRLKVIVNEFGREGIDGALIKETGVDVEEINNGSIFCSCRLDQFEETLKKVSKEQPDIIFVEASGLSDPTNIDKILSQVQDLKDIEYMGCIGLIDAVNFKKVYATARVCKKQIAVSDLLLINKTDMASAQDLSEIESIIRLQNPEAAIHRTVYGEISLSWMDNIRKTPQNTSGCAYHIKDVSLQKMLIVLHAAMTFAQLEKFIKMFIEDTYRIKGFVHLEGKTALVDCVGMKFAVTPFEGHVERVNQIVALGGAGMPMEQSIKKAVEWYPESIQKTEWDM